jgi:hypothetical protein
VQVPGRKTLDFPWFRKQREWSPFGAEVRMRITRFVFLSTIVSFSSVGFATGLSAQKVRLTGSIVDELGAPVTSVDLVLRRGGRTEATARSSETGQFDFGQVSAGTMLIVAQRIGYEKRSLEVHIDPALTQQSVQVDLVRVASNLDTVVISDAQGRLQEFNEHRKASKFGHFYDQNQIRVMNPRYVSELFRKIPGARLAPSPAGGSILRLRGCQPKIWVDGVVAQYAEIDEVIGPGEIAGIEIYPSMAGVPGRYMDRENRACGVVLIWSRQS